MYEGVPAYLFQTERDHVNFKHTTPHLLKQELRLIVNFLKRKGEGYVILLHGRYPGQRLPLLVEAVSIKTPGQGGGTYTFMETVTKTTLPAARALPNTTEVPFSQLPTDPRVLDWLGKTHGSYTPCRPHDDGVLRPALDRLMTVMLFARVGHVEMLHRCLGAYADRTMGVNVRFINSAGISATS
jgi:hypothetical protein